MRTKALLITIVVVLALWAYWMFSNNSKTSFEFAPATATQEERMASYNSFLERAVEGDRIEVNGCDSNPAVLKLKIGGSFQVVNVGDRYTIFRVGGLTSPVKASESVTFQPEFKKGPGVYGYDCPARPGEIIGVVVVTP